MLKAWEIDTGATRQSCPSTTGQFMYPLPREQLCIRSDATRQDNERLAQRAGPFCSTTSKVHTPTPPYTVLTVWSTLSSTMVLKPNRVFVEADEVVALSGAFQAFHQSWLAHAWVTTEHEGHPKKCITLNCEFLAHSHAFRAVNPPVGLQRSVDSAT